MRNGYGQDVAVGNEIILAGIPFPTTGPVRVANITVVPNPIVLGDTSTQTETQIVSQFIQPDAAAGLGVNRANARIQFDRAWTSEAETRYSHQITLPNLVTDLDRPAGETAPPFWVGQYIGKVWAVFGTKVYSYVAPTWTLEHTLPATPTGVVVFQNRIWITTLENGMDWLESPDADPAAGTGFTPNTWYSVPSNSASLVYATGELLFRWYDRVYSAGPPAAFVRQAFWVNRASSTPWATDPPTGGVPNPWAVHVQSGLPIDVFAIVPYVNSGISGTYYVATDGIYFNTNTGLMRLQITYGPLMPGQFGRSAVLFKNDLIIPTGELGLLAYRVGTTDTRRIGLDQEDGVPPAKWGIIDRVVAGQNYLYALVTQRGINDTDPRDIAVYAWDGHWHHVASLASGLNAATGAQVQGYTLTALPDGLYVGYRKADGNPSIRRIDDRPRAVTPKQVGASSAQTRFNFAEGPVVHTTPWYDFGSEIQGKLLLKVQIQVEATATETVEVQYATDLDDTVWTSMGLLTANGLHALPFNGQIGRQVRLVKLRYILKRQTGAANDYKRPLIDTVIIEFMRLLPATYGFAVELDLTKTYKGRSAVDLLDAIKQLSDPVRTPELIPMTYQDDQHREPQTHFVRISRMTGQEYAGRANRGISSYMVSMMAPYAADSV
jgi:hypothetical protein